MYSAPVPVAMVSTRLSILHSIFTVDGNGVSSREEMDGENEDGSRGEYDKPP